MSSVYFFFSFSNLSACDCDCDCDCGDIIAPDWYLLRCC